MKATLCSRYNAAPLLPVNPHEYLMGLQCNIDARGKLARLIWGVLLLILGAVLLLMWALPAGSAAAWVVTAVCLAGGAFAVFEARAGWCVVRAMGFKTRI